MADRSTRMSLGGARTGRRMRRAAVPAAASVLLLAPLAACHDNISAAAADDAQVCSRFSDATPPKKVPVSLGDENLETCAMHIEGWRLMHKQDAVTGSYQGHYVYASAKDITSSTGPKDIRYRVYTPGQHADLDQKIQTLIDLDAKSKAAPSDAPSNEATSNQQGDSEK